MTAYLFLPIYFLEFWFGQAPLRLISHFIKINQAFFQFFSVPLLLRTFFRPAKNEYRKGLIGFSIGIGIFLKSCVILTALLLFIPLLLSEVILFCGFLTFPLITLAVLLWN
ncbi:MAG: hypothetical protein AAB478_01600 [Patescibacteria group bacterium]